MLRPKHPHHRDFVTALKLGAAQAILPSFEREGAALPLHEAHFSEEIRNVGESKNSVERIFEGFFDQRFDQTPAYAVSFGALADGEGRYLPGCRGIKI